MAARQPWSRRELLLALGLYLDPSLGSQDKTNERIIDLAKRIGRSPDSVVFKMANFKHLDPFSEGGFRNVGRRDRELWDDVLNQPAEVHEAIQRRRGRTKSHFRTNLLCSTAINTEGPQQTEAISTAKSRRGQDLFRRAVLSAYQNRCCVTGVSDTRLLVASHIKPWRDDKENRLNPANGLCLNVLHDKAFDIGLITIGEDYRIKISSTLKDGDEDFLNLNLVSYEGADPLPCRRCISHLRSFLRITASTSSPPKWVSPFWIVPPDRSPFAKAAIQLNSSSRTHFEGDVRPSSPTPVPVPLEHLLMYPRCCPHAQSTTHSQSGRSRILRDSSGRRGAILRFSQTHLDKSGRIWTNRDT